MSLEQVRVEDAVTGWSNATIYAYHHGYYDSDEREFRGFGKVEQWDTERVPLDGLDTALAPVRTVTWFHTGAWRQQSTLEDAYATEYFAGDEDAFPRTPCATDVVDDDPAPLTAREQREAARALKGRPLRQEVYGEDDTEQEHVPYSVTETCFTASRLQRASSDIHGVFLVTPLQTLTYHYERDATDPRVVQERTLEVDEYGTVLRTATVVYPRRGTGHADAQATGICLVTRNEVIHDADVDADRWHLSVPWRTRTWQLVPGATPSFFTSFVTASSIDGLLPSVAGGTASTTLLDFDEELSSTDYLKKIADKVTTYDDGVGEADPGEMGERALPWQVYQLAFTTTQADAHGDRLSDLGVLVTVLDQGYIDLTTLLPSADAEGTWARSGTQTRDSTHFYVPTAFTDPFGNTTAVSWHASYLFAESVTDALDNQVVAAYDLQALAPETVTDPNGTVTAARFDALGRVTAIARSNGTDGETDLDDPSQSFSYDLTVVPAVAYAAVRDLHASDPAAATDTRWIETYAYSDGAGNVVMQKATTAPDAATPTTPRWVGSGRVVLNNKGLPIKQYEPFFADSEAFEAEEGFAGVTPVITYDPLGRAIRVDLPNGTLRRVEFTPWDQVTYDENDTIDEGTAESGLVATVPTSHKNTPTTVHLDVQGRPYATEEVAEAGGTVLVTTLTLDVFGNPRVVNDARGNDIQIQTFDLLGRPILTDSPDGGNVTALHDVAGAPRFQWKSDDVGEETEYDALRRRVRTWEWATAGTPAKTLRERFVYGESLASLSYDPVDACLRGRLYRSYEGGGFVELGYDWKGNTTRMTRRFMIDGESEPDWTSHDGGAYPFAGDDDTSVGVLHTSAAGDLESEEFEVLTTFDALDRVVTSEAPDGQTATYTYDDGGRLYGVSVANDIVAAISYNARGQRESISYGNGTSTEYTYESDTLRLSTMVTTRTSDSAQIQDLRYSYDPVGNIVAIENAAADTLYCDNTSVSPNQTFGYDALYRLVRATGREKDDRTQPWSDDPTFLGLASEEITRTFTEEYSYDAVGNITSMVHKEGATTLWTRTYTFESTSNRLLSTAEASGTKIYAHDDRGNIVYLPNLLFSSTQDPNVVPNYRNQMTHANLASSTQEAFYAYDAGGQRVRKVVHQGDHTERRYVGGWEVWRKYDTLGAINKAMTTLHVMDGQSRVAMIETVTWEGGAALDPGDYESVTRYQLGNHVGSVAVELDEDGGIISYEEYHPYGSTAWWVGSGATVSQKRYRYTGMERDEETGLQCHGVRYYAVWLGRWISADPMGLGDGVNRFAYTRGNPNGGSDPSGMDDEVFDPVDPAPDDCEDTPEPKGAEVGPTPTRGATISSLKYDWKQANMDIFMGRLTPQQYRSRWGDGFLDNQAYKMIYLSATVARGVLGSGRTDVSYEAAELIGNVVLFWGPGRLATAESVVASEGVALETGVLDAFAPSATRGTSGAGLIHFTDDAGASGIASTGVLRGRGGIFALPESAARRGPVSNALLTGIGPSKTTNFVQIPEAANGAFQRVIPIGPYSTLKTLGGVRFSAPGMIDMNTGVFTQTGPTWVPYAAVYGPDALAYAGMGASAAGAYWYGTRGRRHNDETPAQ